MRSRAKFSAPTAVNVPSRFVVAVVTLGAIMGPPGTMSGSPSDREGRSVSVPRRNVLLIVADDLNTALGTYGNAQIKTPNIDRLAASGVRFDRAYCQYPLCGPSRASFLTGLRPDTTGVYVNRLFRGEGVPNFRTTTPGAVTLPQMFKNSGAFAARVGKLFHYNVPQDIGTDGDDDAGSWSQVVNLKGRDKFVEDKMAKIGGSVLFSWHADETSEPHTDELGTSAAIRLLEEYRARPFFIAVGFFRPHWPYIAPKRFFDMYPADKIRLPTGPGLFAENVPAAAYSSSRDFARILPMLTDPVLRENIRAYYAAVSFVDEQVGRLMEAVARLGLRENTIIVFISDHGYHLGEHGLWQKKSLWEASLRVPLIIAVPGTKNAGRITRRTVELVDLYSTLADLCGLEKPRTDGRSLRPLLEDTEVAWPYPAFSQMQIGAITNTSVPGIDGNFMGRSVRTEHWRYTQWGNDGEHGEQLYDMARDPGETRNLANDPAWSNEKAQLRAMVKANVNNGDGRQERVQAQGARR